MTEVISKKNKSKVNKSENQILAKNYLFVEMKPVKALPIYQFKLYPHLDLNVAYVLIRDQSEILDHLRMGQKVDMLYHSKKAETPVKKFKTQILDITKKEQGPLKGHFKVALTIVD